MNVTIVRHEQGGAGEYHAEIEGHDEVGRLTWVERNGARVATHTYTPPALRGRDIAARLVEAMVADAREQGFKIVPQCSYVEVAFRRHPEWTNLRA